MNPLLFSSSQLNQQYLCLLFHYLGYTVDTVTNEQACLTQLAAQTYSLVLTDMRHPYEGAFIERLHQLRRNGQLPYVVSINPASCPDTALNEALIQEHIALPISPSTLDEILTRARQFWTRHQAMGGNNCDRTSTADSPSAPQQCPELSLADRPIVNSEVIDSIRNLAGESAQEFLSDLVECFIADTAQRIETTIAAVSRSNCEDLIQAAHSLRSSSANLGAERVSKVCEYLELTGKAGKIPDLDWCRSTLAAEYAAAKSYLIVTTLSG